jgi:hypothetical protein
LEIQAETILEVDEEEAKYMEIVEAEIDPEI